MCEKVYAVYCSGSLSGWTDDRIFESKNDADKRMAEMVEEYKDIFYNSADDFEVIELPFYKSCNPGVIPTKEQISTANLKTS